MIFVCVRKRLDLQGKSKPVTIACDGRRGIDSGCNQTSQRAASFGQRQIDDDIGALRGFQRLALSEPVRGGVGFPGSTIAAKGLRLVVVAHSTTAVGTCIGKSVLKLEQTGPKHLSGMGRQSS
jgi:hypothetical protein